MKKTLFYIFLLFCVPIFYKFIVWGIEDVTDNFTYYLCGIYAGVLLTFTIIMFEEFKKK